MVRLASDLKAFTCPACGSLDVRRSMPHDLWERAIRASTPYHLYFCRGCGRRGWYRGTLTLAPADQIQQGLPAREIEARDDAARRRRRHRAMMSLLVAILSGTGAALYLHGCQQRAALTAPVAE